MEESPDYIPALAYKAWAMAQQPSYMWSDDPEADRRAALALAGRAARGVGEDAPALVALSAAHSMCVRDTVPALRFADRALAIDPNNAWGWMRRGWGAIHGATPEQALDAFEHAERLSPLDPFLFNVRIGQATALGRLGEARRAADIVEEAILFWPGVEWACRSLARIRARMPP